MFARFLDKLIWSSFLLLAIVTPLLFTTQNTELYEVPKMLFVYFFAIIIFFSTLAKFALEGKILVPGLWSLVTLVLFALIQVASTFTSIDKFTSVFGYPSRLNGGLLSQFAYLAIFFCALVNLSKLQSQKLLTAIVIAAFAVSIWGIPGHFGRDPSCFVLVHRLTSDCWQEDFNPKIRIFSTMGQPNWLAQYLVLIIPLALAFLLSEKNSRIRLYWSLVTITLFVAFIFTNSRSGAVGLLVSLIVFAVLVGKDFIRKNLKLILPLTFMILISITVFGATLFTRLKEGLTQKQQLGTESTTIRLIVWQGAFEVFKHNPIFGTGPETFAYSYYQYRPVSHNATTEWNFFYNKAHNEFLNYLANTGLLGIVAYLAFLLTALFALYRSSRLRANDSDSHHIFSSAAFASVLGYQTTIFFGFSTVASQLVMFLMIPLVLIISDQTSIKQLSPNLPFRKLAAFIILLVALWLLTFVLRIYFADVIFQRAKSASDTNSIIRLSNAVDIFPGKNPFYLSEYAYTNALLATSTEDQEAAKVFKNEAESAANLSLRISPKNIVVIRKIASTYLLLIDVDESDKSKAIALGLKLVQIAPTDPSAYLSLAKILATSDHPQEAKDSLNLSLKLKPDYQDAKELLEQIKAKELQ